MFYNFRKNKKGFTLVELIVVIAIIAILGSVVGVVVAGFVDDARVTAVTSPLGNLKEQIDLVTVQGKSVKDILIKLFPDKYNKNFWISDVSAAGYTTLVGKSFSIYFNTEEDGSGKYWGTLEISNGVAQDVTSSETEPATKVKVS